jgi:hypothetical protein
MSYGHIISAIGLIIHTLYNFETPDTFLKKKSLKQGVLSRADNLKLGLVVQCATAL